MKFINPKLTPEIDRGDATDSYLSHDPFIRGVFRWRLKKVLELCPEKIDQDILDIGIGSGVLLPSLCQYGNVYGIDIELKFVKKSRKVIEVHKINAILLNADIIHLPFQDNKFDTIYCISVLEHIKDLDSVLKEISRVMKNNGILIVGVPVEGVLVNAFFRYRKIDEYVREVHVSNHNDIKEKIQNHLKIVEERRLPLDFLSDSLSFYKIFKCQK